MRQHPAHTRGDILDSPFSGRSDVVTIPEPDADARAHSDALREGIRQFITAEGGRIPFSKFMELCLYAPGLGYYSAGARKFGAAGDFVTAPEIGSLFAQCVAEATAPVLSQLGGEGDFLEIGGGSGAFAADVLQAFEAQGILPRRYKILEPSADLRERQAERVRDVLPTHLAERVEWLDGPISESWRGVVFANEVIDALPTTRFVIGDEEVLEEYVELDGENFTITTQPADALTAAAVRSVELRLDAPLPQGYRSEILPQLPYWVQAVIGPMAAGVLLFADYGYPRRAFYHATRSDGTLRAFRRHHVVSDVMAWPGLQDITASVDFTALAEAGTDAGFSFAGYCTQADFLIANGLEKFATLAEGACADEVARLRIREQVKRLTLPSEMGERFQVMGFSHQVEFDAAFLLGDRSYSL